MDTMSLHVLDSISEPAHPGSINQDYFRAFKNGVILLDGASPLQKDSPFPTHDFVQEFTDAFSIFAAESDTDTKTLIQKTIDSLVKSSGMNDLSQSPSASAIIMRFNGKTNKLEFVQIGDCKSYIMSKWGLEEATPVFKENRVYHFDQIALNVQMSYMKLGFNAQEARRLINPLLISHRSMLNLPKGYASLSLSSSCNNYISCHEYVLKSNTVYKVMLASDGFYSGFEDYEPGTLPKIMDGMISLKNALEKYRKIERRDSELIKHPRFKVHDDASCVLIEISTN